MGPQHSMKDRMTSTRMRRIGGLRIGLAAGAVPAPAQAAALRRLEADKPLSPPPSVSPDGVACGFVRAHRDVWELSEGKVDPKQIGVEDHARRTGSEGAAIVFEAGRFRAPVHVMTLVPGTGSGTAKNGPVVIPSSDLEGGAPR
jgi:hypothetical protein